MLSSLKIKPNRTRDLRFVDLDKGKHQAGVLKARRSANLEHSSLAPAWARSGSSCSWYSSQQSAVRGEDVQENVSILEVAERAFKREQKKYRTPTKLDRPTVHHLKREAFPFKCVNDVSSQAAPLNNAPKPAIFAPEDFALSIGVFSDTRSYSALIRNELTQYQVNLKHFNHPRTFVSEKFPFFDRISAWLVFLSEEDNDVFLDQFCERYIDKPLLFLCPKMKRQTASTKIADFVQSHLLDSVSDR